MDSEERDLQDVKIPRRRFLKGSTAAVAAAALGLVAS